jgi:hypothetical protein
MAQQPNREKASTDAKNTKVSPAPPTWTFLEDEAEKSGLIMRNPAPNTAAPIVTSYTVIKVRK